MDLFVLEEMTENIICKKKMRNPKKMLNKLKMKKMYKKQIGKK